MKQQFGILLLEKTEVILRVYETDGKEWKLLYYQNKNLKEVNQGEKKETLEIIEIISEFLLTNYTQHIAEWKICARTIAKSAILSVSSATGLAIEDLTLLREQELLCKGMFTELW